MSVIDKLEGFLGSAGADPISSAQPDPSDSNAANPRLEVIRMKGPVQNSLRYSLGTDAHGMLSDRPHSVCSMSAKASRAGPPMICEILA